MSYRKEVEGAIRRLEELNSRDAQPLEGARSTTRRITIDKRTHRVRLENETEASVEIIIERRDEEEMR